MFVFCKDRLKLYGLATNFFIIVGIGQFMKLVYHHPRPFWVNSKITGVTCEKGFGHPSGHSSAPLFVLYAVYVDYILEMESVKNNQILQIVIGVSFIVLDLGIIYGRLYLGVHGIDQVTYGAILGIYYCVFYEFFSRQHMMMVLTYLNRNMNNSEESEETLMDRRVKLSVVLLVVVAVSSTLLVGLFLYLHNNLQM